MKITYILVIILLFIIILLYNKKENFIVGNEAINNIASVYADVSGTATFNNVRTKDIITNDIISNDKEIIMLEIEKYYLQFINENHHNIIELLELPTELTAIELEALLKR